MKNQSFKGLKKVSLASAIGVFAFTYAGTTLANEEVVENQVVDTDVVETVDENQTEVINEAVGDIESNQTFTDEIVEISRYEEIINHEYLTEEDSDLLPQDSYIKTIGEYGSQEIITYEVYDSNGLFADTYEEINVLKEAVDEVYVVGTAKEEWISSIDFETLPFETKYIEDPEMYEGDSYIDMHGMDGVIENHYETYYINGVEQSKELLEEHIYAPMNEIIVIGTKNLANQDDFTSDVTNTVSIIDQTTNNLIESLTFNGWIFDYRLGQYVDQLNINNGTEYEIVNQKMTDSTKSSISTPWFSQTLYSRTHDVFVRNNNTNTISAVRPFLPEGTIYDDINTNRTLREISIINSYNNETLYNNQYISYLTTDADIREAMSNVDSDLYYFDYVDVNSGFASIVTNEMSYHGLSEDVSIYVNKIDMYELNPSTESIPYETIYVYDNSLPEGEEYIQIEGVDGAYYIDTENHYRYGELIDSREVGRHIGEEPINQVIAIGTGTIEEIPGEETPDQSETEVPSEGTPDQSETDVPGEENTDQSETEVPGEENTDQSETEVPGDETTEQSETEVPGEENSDQPETEVPGEETPEQPVTEVPGEETPEQPDTEVPGEENTEQPETEVPGAVTPEQPESQVSTEETPEESEAPVEQTETDNNHAETDVVNNTESAQIAETATPENDNDKEERLPDTGVAQSNNGVIAAVAAFFGGLLLFVKGRRKESK